MKTIKTILTLMALLLPFGAWAATVTIPTEADKYISWSDATLTNCNTENGGSSIGSTHNGSTATFTLSNATKQDYYLMFLSGANGLTATVSWTLTDGDSYLHQRLHLHSHRERQGGGRQHRRSPGSHRGRHEGYL